MRILGVDPGACTGYGIIDAEGSQIKIIDFGSIRPSSKLNHPDRCLSLFNALETLIEIHSVDVVSVETQFVYKNAQSAMKLGIIRGMALLAGARKGIPIFEYSPKKAKLAVTGNGAASKECVQKMLQLLFRLPCLPEPEDAADALALAVCHAHHL